LSWPKPPARPVFFTPVESSLEVAEPIKSADAPLVVERKRVPIMAIEPTGEEVQLAEVVTPPLAQTEIATVAAPAAERTLPSTASQLPLMVLFGVRALGGALALRVAEKRVQ
jgi:hypothetical protein